MSNLEVSTVNPPCPMCNDKQGMGAPPAAKPQTTACKRCLDCKTCSAQMSAGDKYSVKVSDQQIQEYKETFLMFDKAGRQGATIQGLSGFTLRTEMGLSLPRSWGRY